MEFQTIKENGKVKFVVLPVEDFEILLDRLEREDDLMNPVKRERMEKGWTQEELARRLGVKQSTVAKWERPGAVYRKKTREKLAKVFGVNESTFR